MERYLAHMTWLEVDSLAKDPGVVILPLGATEQHGPHLPLATDTLIADACISELFRVLLEDVPAWALPTLPITKSNEHRGYAGTLALRAETLLQVVTDVGRSVAEMGFRRLLFLNAHGGNKALLEMACRDLRDTFGLLCFLASPSPLSSADREALPALEARFGIHAGTVETALIMATHPDLAKPERAQAHYPAFTSQTLNLTSPPQVGWLTRDWSPQGHFGDPSAATPKAGARYLAQAGKTLAALVQEIASFEVAHGS